MPGLVQIHGGGQYADYKACLTNAKRSYATVSIAWAGRISAPGLCGLTERSQIVLGRQNRSSQLQVDHGLGGRLTATTLPAETREIIFRVHNRQRGRSTRSSLLATAAGFWCALAARRALTFLEQQPEVDPDRLGVYGHSMGGKLTVMTAFDSRVKAAVPSCGGISDRYSDSPLFRATIGDDVSLKKIKCPIIFLSPANDFHGRIGDLPDSINEIATKDWRVTCSPHHNHQDTADYEVATQLWFDQHLQNSFEFPATPETDLTLKNDDGVPIVTVNPDQSMPILSVDIFYTQHGVAGRDPHENSMHRFWHHAAAKGTGGVWAASLPSEQP